MAKQIMFEDAVASQPKKHEIRLPMVADSSAETAIEIDTKIGSQDKVGWMIIGLDWYFETIASPHTRIDPFSAGNTDFVFTLQLCRGEAPGTPVYLRGGDNDLMLEDTVIQSVATAVGFRHITWPRKPRGVSFTQQSEIHLLFGTNADCAEISDPTIQIFANLLYVPMKSLRTRGANL